MIAEEISIQITESIDYLLKDKENYEKIAKIMMSLARQFIHARNPSLLAKRIFNDNFGKMTTDVWMYISEHTNLENLQELADDVIDRRLSQFEIQCETQQ
ncbi:MAG: hypothetical protein ACOH2V_00390 [Candidatus Saccharimonadaceae bacterium]